MWRPVTMLVLGACSCASVLCGDVHAASPACQGSPAETALAVQWADRFAPTGAAAPEGSEAGSREPFSFLLGSRKSAALLPSWTATSAVKDASTSVVRRSAWRDPQTGLEVIAEATRYNDFPAVEWVLRFRNGGTADTPVLEQILPFDVRVPASDQNGRPAVLHHAKGALCSIDDFAPVETQLAPGTKLRLEAGGGRSSSEALPFFNLDWGGRGIVLGIGWTGQWALDVRVTDRGELALQAGLAHTHLKLRPGEEIRSPRILVLCWEGDRMRGNNLLRRFLLAHHRPKPNGKPLVLPVLVGSWGGAPAVEHLSAIDRIVRRDLPIELYWIDAEWFGGTPWYSYPGNWTVRRELYPQGFRPISQSLHRSGRKLLLWFEPQRVCRGTPWAEFRDRPGWLLELNKGNPAYQQRNMNWGVPHEDPRWIEWESRRSQICEGDMLWNMGHPDARRYLTDWLSERIEQFGLDWYREDFNIAPLEYWHEADEPDRRGITEIRYVEGLYAMWDELLQRHPHLAIDNCASGGRRIDLETTGRATALWRTDWPVDAIHRQCHTFGLMAWVPLHMSDGAVLAEGNEYEVRSAMTAGLNVKLPPQDDEPSARQAKAIIDQYLSIQQYFYGDYYPLTPYSRAADVWLAYQLHLPERDEGVVVALKRPASSSTKAALRLHDLAREATYEVSFFDTAESKRISGSVLTGTGLEIELSNKPDSALVRYCRVP